MDPCSGGCPAYDRQFSAKSAATELRAYRRDGPPATTRRLIDGLAAAGVGGLTVLDVGAGVGAVHHALLEAGATSAVDVDASGPYLEAAREEAERRGHAHRVRHIHGDFVSLATDLEPADLVALDRVICCYGDMPALVARSSALARRRYGLVYPVDRWWTRLAVRLANLWCRVTGDPFRIYVHPASVVDEEVRRQGLTPASRWAGRFWQVAVYERPAEA